MFERSYKNLNTHKTHYSVFHVFQAKLRVAKLKARQGLLALSLCLRWGRVGVRLWLPVICAPVNI